MGSLCCDSGERWGFELDENAIAAPVAVKAAQRRLQSLGHPEARPAQPHEDPEGVDVVTPAAVARVDAGDGRTGVDVVVGLAGVAALERKTGCVFSVQGFTDEAVAWSDRASVALFVFDRQGGSQPVGRVAADAVARSVTANPRFGTGSRADPLQVASVVTEGLVGGEVGEVAVWFGGLGRLLEFHLEPGDNATPARVVVNVYPPSAPEPRDFDEGWSHARRHLPGGGREDVLTRHCVQANHPPTVVAGEAVVHASEALRVCGVDFAHGRIELRRGPELDEETAAEVRGVRAGVFGPLTRDLPLQPPVSDPATPAAIATRLLARARGPIGGGEGANGAAHTELQGVGSDGDVAWKLVARRTGGLLRGVEAWEIEARIRGDLLESHGPGQWLRSPTIDVGATTWQLVRDWWRTVDSDRDLEAVAHEVVADLAAAYALAGARLERTTLR